MILQKLPDIDVQSVSMCYKSPFRWEIAVVLTIDLPDTLRRAAVDIPVMHLVGQIPIERHGRIIAMEPIMILFDEKPEI